LKQWKSELYFNLQVSVLMASTQAFNLTLTRVSSNHRVRGWWCRGVQAQPKLGQNLKKFVQLNFDIF